MTMASTMQHPYHHNNNNEDESTLGSRSYREGTIDYGDDGQSLTNNNMTMQPTSPQLPRIVNAGLQLQSLLRSEMSGNVSFVGLYCWLLFHLFQCTSYITSSQNI